MISEEQLVQKINSVALTAGDMAISFYNKPHEVSIKKDKSIATDADREIEKRITSELEGILEDSYFIGEEGSENHPDPHEILKEAFRHKYVWAIDPIDGTDNFTSGAGEFATSIGLMKNINGRLVPYLGAVILPKSRQLYFTDSKKSYSLLNGEVRELQKPIVMNNDGKPLSFLGIAINEGEIKKLDISKLYNIRVPGSTVVQIINTAIGGYYGTRTGAHIWDFAAALAIGKPIGSFAFDQETGEKVDGFKMDEFMIGNPKTDWKIKRPVIVCAPECKDFIMNSYKVTDQSRLHTL